MEWSKGEKVCGRKKCKGCEENGRNEEARRDKDGKK